MRGWRVFDVLKAAEDRDYRGEKFPPNRVIEVVTSDEPTSYRGDNVARLSLTARGLEVSADAHLIIEPLAGNSICIKVVPR